MSCREAPGPAALRYGSVVASNTSERYTQAAVPCSELVPDLVIWFMTAPPARPYSALKFEV